MIIFSCDIPVGLVESNNDVVVRQHTSKRFVDGLRHYYCVFNPEAEMNVTYTHPVTNTVEQSPR